MQLTFRQREPWGRQGTHPVEGDVLWVRIDAGTYWVALGRSAEDRTLVAETDLDGRLFGT